MWDLRSGGLLDSANFFDRVGCSTDTYLLYKAIVGDASDCIPGVPGLGEKRAAELLERAHWDVRAVREPKAQLHSLLAYVKQHRAKCSKPERAILRYRRRLERVLGGIDLRASFGSTRGLVARLDAPPKAQPMAFARACAKLGIRNVFPALTRPFVQVEKTRR